MNMYEQKLRGTTAPGSNHAITLLQWDCFGLVIAHAYMNSASKKMLYDSD